MAVVTEGAREGGTLGPTEELSRWVSAITLGDIPEHVQVRAKHLILDGLVCGLIGAHLPWSEKATKALLGLEGTLDTGSVIFGWGGVKTTALSSALINSTFIQGFELDDWHSEAPLHSNSILLPALFAAAQHRGSSLGHDQAPSSLSGSDLLLATIVGYEVGPRIGRALHGSHVLSTGWHSGAVFGPGAAAASVGKLLGLSPGPIEDAFGIACTQACGLMSAQFESEVKRMQHGFAARNGLMAAFLAQGGYTGIKRVFEREYGGFLKQFSSGNGKTPPYLADELTKDLGARWQTERVRVKPYAAMAGTHPTIDAVRRLQEKYPEHMRDRIGEVTKIKITMGDAAFHHGGWKANRPLTSTGAQMSNTFVAATQIVHGEVLASQFNPSVLENEEVWRLVNVSDCELADSAAGWPASRQTVTVEFRGGQTLSQTVESAWGVNPPLSNEEIVEKWRSHTRDIIDADVARRIEKMVLSLDQQGDLAELLELMGTMGKSPIG